jgi:acetyltransferase-like isoleucine patch superfamily enzyme
MVMYEFSDVLLVVASPCNNMASLLLGGDGATVFLGPRSAFTGSEIYCGERSTVVVNAEAILTRCAIIDARNGGSVIAEADQLWAANVYVATDDMHRLEDAETGARINPYGAQIRLGRHVWLGRDAIITGHCDVGDGAVVGTRAMLRGQKVPARTAVAGCPAKVIREDVTWRGEDTP